MKKEVQEIYINLDDSGKLSSKEDISVYGGVVFLSKKEKDKFITQYKKIINEVKCEYCKICNHACPEIKNTNIKPEHKRWLMNYIKNYFIVGLIIENKKVYEEILQSKASKGRFIDYAIRRLIKEILKSLIKEGKIDPYKPVKIILNIDQQSTKSNGYYNLHDGILEELKYGISAYNYSAKRKRIVYSDLEILVTYQVSAKSYVIQAADLLAGTIRRTVLDNMGNYGRALSKFVDLKIKLP